VSGLAIALNLRGGPVCAARVTRMLAPLRHRPYDRQGIWSGPTIAIAHLAYDTTPEAQRERQPLQDERGEIVLVMDGRVDNRAELAAALRERQIAPCDETDAELVLGAYRLWGVDCAQKIVGDFAFAIWDGRRLFCARDILGLRPFYYYCDGKLLLCASAIPQLLADPDVPRRPNEGMAGEYLSDNIKCPDETLFQGIMQLPPRHCLVASQGRVAIRAYYDLSPRPLQRYRDDRECAAQLLSVLTEAVRCRLRSPTGVWVELSGGLDSSSVAAIAGSRAAAAQDAARPRTVSIVFPGRPCDERPYIEQVVSALRLDAQMVEFSAPTPTPYLAQVRRHLDFPGYPNFAPDTFRRVAQSSPARVALTGQGGDEWLAGSPFHQADLLRALRLTALARQIRCDARVFRQTFGDHFGWSVIRNYCLAPLLPARWRRIARRLIRRDSVAAWIAPDFARRCGLRERLQAEPERRFPSLVQDSLRWDLVRAQRIHELAIDARVKADVGWELRHPFMDRRLIEFALALPEEQRWRGTVTKFALRNATAQLLPQAVRERVAKVHFNDIFSEAAQAMMAWLAPRELTAAGWIRSEAVAEMFTRCRTLYERGDARHILYANSLWMVFGLELWLRAAFRPEALPEA